MKTILDKQKLLEFILICFISLSANLLYKKCKKGFFQENKNDSRWKFRSTQSSEEGQK